MERIDTINPDISLPGTTLFLDGPAEFLVAAIVSELKKVTQWTEVFGEFIDPYERQDYSERNLPALRVYNENYVKTYDSWFIEGEIKADIILPAALRRAETQQIQDSLSSAMLQQFRRQKYFDAVSSLVPGLNELGKTFSVDKTLGLQLSEDQDAYMTQITLNFRIDLRQWDLYLEASLRTKNDPFEETLGNLKRIAGDIQALRDELEKELDVQFNQKI